MIGVVFQWNFNLFPPASNQGLRTVFFIIQLELRSIGQAPRTPTKMAQDVEREIRLQRPAVDFVETRLPQYHRAFDYPHAQFDPINNRFVDASRTNVAMQLQPYHTRLSHDPVQTTPPPLPPKVSATSCGVEGGLMSELMELGLRMPELKCSFQCLYLFKAG